MNLDRVPYSSFPDLHVSAMISLLKEILPMDTHVFYRNRSALVAPRSMKAALVFVDVVGFSKMALTADALSLFGMINELFTLFDNIVLRSREGQKEEGEWRSEM